MKYRIEYSHTTKDFDDVWHIEEKYLEPSTIVPMKQVIEWDKKNNDIHIFVKDIEKDKVVGEITILPLSQEQFNKFMDNKLVDTEINADTLLKYNSNKNYYLLLAAIAIDLEYRNDRKILSLLLKGFYDKLIYLKNKNINFLNMCAEGQSSDGQKFIENFLNLKHKKTTDDGYKLYCFDNENEFDNWLVKFPSYIEAYNKKFYLQ